MSVIEKTLTQALKMLDAVGAKYKVVMPDGTQHGVLELAEQKNRSIRHRVFANAGYLDKLRETKPGGVEVFTPPDGTTAEEMRSAVCGSAFRLWGKGNYKTAVTNGNVEILRLQ